MTISLKDKQILRETAAHQTELANAPHNAALEQLWLAHNACADARPTILIDWRPFAAEIIKPLMHCEGEVARQIEYSLYSNFISQELFNDDQVVPSYMPIHVDVWFAPLGYEPHEVNELYETPRSSGAIIDLKNDFHKLGKSRFGVNMQKTQNKLEMYSSLLGNILPARLTGGGLYALPTRCMAYWMSVQTMHESMKKYPELFHKMLDMLTDDYIEYFRFCERRGLILPTTRFEPVSRGSFAFTDELPGPDVAAKRPLSTHDVWGFLGTQELADISPDMFKEFMLPCFKQISCMYGMLSYGFSERVDLLWDDCLDTLPNLRKLSISPGCNDELMGERLRGTNIVFHKKPQGYLLSAPGPLDESALRTCVKQAMSAARGCTVEFSQLSAATVHGDVRRVRRYVELVREYSAE